MFVLVTQSTTHHAVLRGFNARDGGTLWGMSVTEAAPSDHQLVDGIVIFLQDVKASVQQVISQSVKLSEVDTQIGDSQKFCRDVKQMDCVWFVESF